MLLQPLQRLRVRAQVPLGAHQKNGHAGAVVRHLGVPLVPHVGEGRGAADGEADDEDVGLRVGERAQAVVLLLARRVPQVEADRSAVHAHLSAVVVEHGGDVLLGKSVGGVGDEEARLAHRPIANHHTLNGLHSTSSRAAAPAAKRISLICDPRPQKQSEFLEIEIYASS